MRRLFLGALAVTVVSWIWSVGFYVLSPIPYWTVSQTLDDRAAGAALLEHFPASGTYILPGRDSGRSVRSEMRANGPVATVYLVRDGRPQASPLKTALGTLQGIVYVICIIYSVTQPVSCLIHGHRIICLYGTTCLQQLFYECQRRRLPHVVSTWLVA